MFIYYSKLILINWFISFKLSVVTIFACYVGDQIQQKYSLTTTDVKQYFESSKQKNYIQL